MKAFKRLDPELDGKVTMKGIPYEYGALCGFSFFA